MLVRALAAALVALLPSLATAQALRANDPAALDAAARAAADYLQRNAHRHGLAAADVAELVVTDRVPGPRGVEHVYLRQAVGGVEVASGPLTVGLDRHGRVFHAAGRLTPGLAAKAAAAPKRAAVPAEAAVSALAEAAGVAPSAPFAVVARKGGPSGAVELSGGGATRLPVRARLVYAEVGGALRLVWEATLYTRGAGGDWHGWVDAETGAVVMRQDLLVREAHPAAHAEGSHAAAPTVAAPASIAARTAPAVATMLPLAARRVASYSVYGYPAESPNHTDTLPPADGRVVASGEEDALASPFGWHDTDGADGPEFTTTRGNNTHAYLDRDDDERPDGPLPDGGEGLTFAPEIDLTADPSLSADAAVVNLFYWSNLIHDVLWRYGFDEASGNFQATNYSGAGEGGDAVDSEAQSGADICNEPSPCVNNANFSTPPEGDRPRMQMYVGDRAGTPEIDGSYDNGVVIHEYGHGVSIRLTGGPSNVSCLSTFSYPEQMGEGWSDYLGMILTLEAGDARGDVRGMGTYLFGQPADGPGIRPAPYSTDFAVNDWTYAHTNTRNPSRPHGIGFVWATILWEMTWDLIDELGYDPDLHNADGGAGNQVALALVTEGMKLQPCGPGFVDGRDAILAADAALYDGAHTDLLWEAFARRGLGFGADQGSSTSNSDNVESFIVPESIPPGAVTDMVAEPNGDFVTLAFTATGDDGTVGTATRYEVRSAAAPILTEAEWEAATPRDITGDPSESGTAEAILAGGLDFMTEYHFALKVIDDAANVGPLSNSASATTLGPPTISAGTDAITFVAPAGGQATATAAIGNAGQSDLRYTIALREDAAATAARRAGWQDGAAARLAALDSLAAPQPEPKGAPATPAPALGADRGGPDAFGYRWIDSNEDGGPAYGWVDISATGAALTLGDDDARSISLPFSFPYYGELFDQVSVESNGALSFGTDDVAYTNERLPSSSEDGIVAVYWDDLNPSSGGQVFYQDMGDGRFVVQWDAVPHYNNAGAFTFQAILESSGAIVMQYEALDFDVHEGSATIGIESPDGSDALQVVFNQPYAEAGLAVRFSAFWGEATPPSGRVAAGTSADIALTADASGLSDGVYLGVMEIASNDPDAPSTEVPLRLVVGDATAPVASVEPGSVEMDVAVGASGQAEVTVRNVGGGDMDWSLAIPTTQDWLSVDATPGTLAPGESATVALTATPQSQHGPGDELTGGFTVETTDPNQPQIDVAVTMKVTGSTAGEDGLGFEGPYLLQAVSPNPAGRTARAALTVRDAQPVRAEVLDLLGRRVALVHDGPVAAGERVALELDASALSAGAYVLRVTGAAFATAQRITVAR